MSDRPGDQGTHGQPGDQGTYGQPGDQGTYGQPGDQGTYGQPGDQGTYGQPVGQHIYDQGYEQEIQRELTQPVNEYIGGSDAQETPPTNYERKAVRTATLMVAYYLKKSDRDYESLINYLKSFGTWWHYLDSAWLVVTDLSASQLRDNLIKYIDSADELFIMDVTDDDWATVGLTKQATDWLQQNMVGSWVAG